MKRRPKDFLLATILAMSLMMPVTACQRAVQTDKEVVEENPVVNETASPEDNGPDKEDVITNRYLVPVVKNAGFSLNYGYADQQGNMVIEPQFSRAQPFYDCGTAIVADQNGRAGLIDKEGNYLVEPKYEYLNYSEGLFLSHISESNTTVAFDERGKKQFEISGYIGVFNSGLSPYYNDSKRGYVDKTGKLVLDLNMGGMSDFSNGMAEVSEKYDGPSYYIDTDGNDLTDKVSSGLRMFRDESTALFGYKDKEGKIVIKAQYSEVKPFFNGFAVINAGDNMNDAAYGVIDTQGNIVLEPVYCGIERMNNGLIVVGEDVSASDYIPLTYLYYSKKAIFSPDFKTHTDWIYDLAENFNNNYICVSDAKTISFLDNSLMPAKDLPEFKGLGTFREDGELLRGTLDYFQTVADLKGTIIARADGKIDLGEGFEAVTQVEARDNSITLLYPVLSGFKDETLQTKINAIIQDDMVKPYRPSGVREPSNLEIVETDYNITRQKNLLLIDQSIYTDMLGSVHGISFRNTLYINSKNGDVYGLNDLFKPGEEAFSYLSENVSAVMKKNMDKVGYVEDHVTITPNTCFALTEEGIVLYFAAYELASYAAGMQEFLIPFTDLTDYIDTQGNFWQSFN